ncbi:MAG: C-GCAxxG-C-C family protein [Actinobacteria bacterium]|nr:C-GCAxxG-C-C family protein [Actinomycetota bacterium]MBU1493308.1 C-GCAxxG-C-C family protein [Actinomycetota bacterium]MBU1865572.1 C-GCAxxG-C-C family protein [Actinomycetota bacterium]
MPGDRAERAYQAGDHYERTYYGCGQCALAALQDVFDRRDDAVFRAATGLAGGGGLACDGSCGAYNGAILFFGQLLGRDRDDFADPAGVRLQTAGMVRELRQRFIDAYGSVTCRNIQTKTMGRPYYIADPEDFRRFHDAGAHDVYCPEVVGRAARWAAEIVEAHGLG